MCLGWGCSSAGEHRVRNAGVEGSNPFISTRKEVGYQGVMFGGITLIFFMPTLLSAFCPHTLESFHLPATTISVSP